MKLQCGIIRDLIPLIEDDVCSPESKDAVLEHIKLCDTCRRVYESGTMSAVFALSADETVAQQSIVKGLRKIKRRWAASVLLVILFVPILFLGWGQFSGRGIAFTNINELVISHAFLRDLKRGDYEAAFRHLDLEPMREEWIGAWFDKARLEHMEEDAQRMFCESASLLIDVGGISEFQFLAVDEQPDYYRIYYTVVVNGKEQEFTLDVTNQGIVGLVGEGSFINEPIAHFAAWSEYLWQEYEGCYFDPETKQYVYHE